MSPVSLLANYQTWRQSWGIPIQGMIIKEWHAEDLGGNRRVLNFDHPGNLQASMDVIK